MAGRTGPKDSLRPVRPGSAFRWIFHHAEGAAHLKHPHHPLLSRSALRSSGGGLRLRCIDSPLSSMWWAKWTSRSRTVSSNFAKCMDSDYSVMSRAVLPMFPVCVFFCLIRYNPVQVFFPRQIFSGSSAIQPDFVLKDPDQLDQPCEPFVLFGKLFALLLGCKIF